MSFLVKTLNFEAIFWFRNDPRTPSFGALFACKCSLAISWQFPAAKAALVHGFLLSQFPKRPLRALLQQIPNCHAIATTGEKATGEVCRFFNIDSILALGSKTELEKGLFLYRLPSSSRAYPLAFDKKGEAYRSVFKEVFS